MTDEVLNTEEEGLSESPETPETPGTLETPETPETPEPADAETAAVPAEVSADDMESADADETDEGGALWDDGPASPEDGSALWTDGAEGGAEPVLATVSAGSDPWVRFLLVSAMSLVVVLLVTTGMLYYYMSTLNHAPRTLSEQEVTSAEAAAHDAPKNVDSWRTLAYAYSSAGRYDEALQAAAKGEKLPDGEIMATVSADVLRFAGRIQESIKEYDRAERKAKQLLERVKAERAKVGITVEIENDVLFRVYWGRAISKEKQGDAAGAIKDYELATKENSRQTDVWLALGALYEKAGKVDKAKAAYTEALRYVPDLAGAKAGLKRLGESD